MTDRDDLLWRNLKDLPAFRGLLRAVEARFYQDLPLPEPVLDLGCGDAHFAAVAFDRPLAAGVDPWTPPLREARRLRRSTYTLLAQAEGGRLPFPNCYFASAMSNSVLEHIPIVEPVLAEVARVLRPGAQFIFCVPSEYFLEFLSLSAGLRRIGLRGAAELYQRWFNRISRHYHCDGPPVWRQRLEAAGMRLEQCWYYFSPAALRALEWGHYLGLPAAVAHALTGRWVLAPTRANLAITERLLRPFFAEARPAKGAYLFFIARRN
ncbi:MAG: class I SAM-dependent methyltransferase [Anaerolineales bacterium]|nr:class I SAM-dependent methyltransferase [Anaerolineales bacterium]